MNVTTSSFRTTQRSISERTLSGLQGNLSRLGLLQEQLSSGKLIAKPSDSPTGTVSAMQLRSEIRTNQQWSRNADDGLGWLGTIDSTLTGSLSAVRRVRDLTLQGMSTGSSTATSRGAIAVEVEGLRENLIGLANTTYLDRPVFGGTTGGRIAYDTAGTYVGVAPHADPRVGVNRTVGADANVRVDVTGPEVFGTGTEDLFAIIADIADNLRNDPDALTGDLQRLDAAMNKIAERVASVGASYNRVEQLRQAADDRVMTLKLSLSGVEDIDLPRTIVDLQMQEAAYQAALGATQRIVTPSLADFLR